MSEILTPQQSVEAVLKQHIAEGGRWPTDMPTTLTEAVAWFCGLVEPPSDRWERPYPVVTRNGEERTCFPYGERLTYLVRRFLAMPGGYQRLIVAAAEDGVSWRGDEEPAFRRVIEQTERMKEVGIAAYRAETSKLMRRMRQ